MTCPLPLFPPAGSQRLGDSPFEFPDLQQAAQLAKVGAVAWMGGWVGGWVAWVGGCPAEGPLPSHAWEARWARSSSPQPCRVPAACRPATPPPQDKAAAGDEGGEREAREARAAALLKALRSFRVDTIPPGAPQPSAGACGCVGGAAGCWCAWRTSRLGWVLRAVLVPPACPPQPCPALPCALQARARAAPPRCWWRRSWPDPASWFAPTPADAGAGGPAALLVAGINYRLIPEEERGTRPEMFLR